MLLDNDINKIIDDFILDNLPLIRIKDLDKLRKDTIEVYKNGMSNPSNINKNLEEQEAMITGILDEIGVKGIDKNKEVQRWSANRHMYFFDIALREGEAAKITEIFTKYGLSLDLLKTIQKGLGKEKEKIKINETGQEIEVTIIFDKDNSMQVDRMEIEYKGQVIYRFNQADSFDYVKDKEEFDFENDFNKEHYIKVKQIKEDLELKRINRINRNNYRQKSRHIEYIITNIEEDKYDTIEKIEISRKNNKKVIVFRNAITGKFIKNPYKK